MFLCAPWRTMCKALDDFTSSHFFHQSLKTIFLHLSTINCNDPQICPVCDYNLQNCFRMSFKIEVCQFFAIALREQSQKDLKVVFMWKFCSLLWEMELWRLRSLLQGDILRGGLTHVLYKQHKYNNVWSNLTSRLYKQSLKGSYTFLINFCNLIQGYYWRKFTFWISDYSAKYYQLANGEITILIIRQNMYHVLQITIEM